MVSAPRRGSEVPDRGGMSATATGTGSAWPRYSAIAVATVFTMMLGPVLTLQRLAGR